MLNFHKFRTFSSCGQYDVVRSGEGTMRHVICRVPVHCCLSIHLSTRRMEGNLEVPDRFDMGGSNLMKKEQL